ncbi:MAG: cytochrome b/b6 domain-containing protein [Chloroflexi bacterium]|nr:cytochrome b/b6 domain-containing protein [Chloroflexota bacterium]
MSIDGHASGNRHDKATILRFRPAMRLLHWAHTAAFSLLLGSGLTLYFLPKAHTIIVGPYRLIPLLHGLLGALSTVLLLGVVLLGWPRGIGDDIKKALAWDRKDLARLLVLPMLFPQLRERLQPQGKYASAQKVNVLLTIAFAGGLAVTGSVLLAQMLSRNALPIDLVGHSLDWHDLLAFAAALVLAAHVYFAAIHPGTRASLRGMITGRVSAEWAKKHYGRWAARQDKQSPKAKLPPQGG